MALQCSSMKSHRLSRISLAFANYGCSWGQVNLYDLGFLGFLGFRFTSVFVMSIVQVSWFPLHILTLATSTPILWLDHSFAMSSSGSIAITIHQHHPPSTSTIHHHNHLHHRWSRVLVAATMLGLLLQNLSARLGIVTGMFLHTSAIASTIPIPCLQNRFEPC